MSNTKLNAIEGLKFVSHAVKDEPLRLLGVDGCEKISSPFRLRILLVRDTPLDQDELDDLLRCPCAVALGDQSGDVVHGVLQWVERLDNADAPTHRYLAEMVPSAALFGLTRRSRVFQSCDVVAMVREVLLSYGLVEGAGFDLRVERGLAEREYVVQYEETDWNFIQRWLEREGLFYWFEHHKKGERLVVADQNADASRLSAPIRYRQRNNLDAGQRTIWDWDLTQRRVVARVAVLDYNYRAPRAHVRGKAIVDEHHGFGTAAFYGEHVKSNEEAALVAKLRAERIACERRVFHGQTDCPHVRVGHVLTLTGHYDDAQSGEYLVTRLDYLVGFPVRDERDVKDEPEVVGYRARIEAIPLEVPFRPERRTPQPRINGLVNGHIASDMPGKVAEIDDLGRYKVRLVFDTVGVSASATSRWIRMAQPYSGAGYGTHFPLHKGAEVLIAHIDGDPDRPIIVGAVPNPSTVSPSTSKNASQSVVQTASGIRMEMEDLQP